MFANGQTVVQWMEKLAPKHYAMEKDAIGLQLGTLNKQIKHVLVALDVTEEVVQEAIRLEVDLIIAHHAIIYRPLQHIRTDTPVGRIYEKCIKHDIAVYISHTNLDSAAGGVNDMLSEALQLHQTVPLQEIQGESYGLGRVGRLAEPLSLHMLAEQVKQAYDVSFARVIGDLQRSVHKVAVLGGSGSRYVKHALFAGADVLITGDIDYHTAHDALAAGLAIIDPGHNIEKIMKQQVTAYLNEVLAGTKYTTVVTASQINTEPFQLV